MAVVSPEPGGGPGPDLTDLTVSVNSPVDGGVASGSAGSDGDGALTASNLPPGTSTCVVVIDP